MSTDRSLAGLLARTDEQPSSRLWLAELVQLLGDGVDRFDESFARTVARTLSARAAHVQLPTVEAMGLEDVVATLYMDKDLRLVVTGNHVETGGACQIRWDEKHFHLVPVELLRAPRPTPYEFATLDFSVRGKKATLRTRIGPLPEGQTVTIRALATIGDSVEYRVVALGTEVSASADDLDLI